MVVLRQDHYHLEAPHYFALRQHYWLGWQENLAVQDELAEETVAVAAVVVVTSMVVDLAVAAAAVAAVVVASFAGSS